MVLACLLDVGGLKVIADTRGAVLKVAAYLIDTLRRQPVAETQYHDPDDGDFEFIPSAPQECSALPAV